MPEAVSALSGASFDGFVRVEDAGTQGMITLRGDLSDAGFRGAVTQAAGTDLPGALRIETAGARSLAWMSPDELLLLCPYAEARETVAKLGEALSGTHHLAVNVSDARAMLRIAGGEVREVLAKLTPADVSPGAFGPGQFRRSRLAQIPAAFWMPDEATICVICFRSVARYAFDLLRTAATPGSEVGYFDAG